MVGGALITNCESLMLSVSVDVEHYIHDKSFRHRLILLSLRNSKIGEDILHRDSTTWQLLYITHQ